MVKKIIIKDNNIPYIKNNVSCIGYFDGVHLGHQELIKKTIYRAKELNVNASLICFEPDPSDFINGVKNKHILSYKNRIKTMEYYGIEQIIIIRFNTKIMKISPISFINNYLNKMNIIELVCGFDFRYGYKGEGNLSLLRKRGKFSVNVIPELKYRNIKISSTRIKEAIIKGNFKLANRLLGYDYYIETKVYKCSKIGLKWLINAKLNDSRCVLPINGTYNDNLSINGRNIDIISDSKLKKGQILLINLYEN